MIELCVSKNIKIKSADTTIKDFKRLIPFIKYLPKAWRFGIESFDYNTRKSINKNFSDSDLLFTIEYMIKNMSLLHLYLIYGLPGDNYESWFETTKDIGRLLKDNTSFSDADLFGNKTIAHKVRIDYSISTFEPEENTPLEDESYPDFDNRNKVLNELLSRMQTARIINTEKKLDINQMMGKFGRAKYSYDILMALKRGGREQGGKIINAFKEGYDGNLQNKKIPL